MARYERMMALKNDIISRKPTEFVPTKRLRLVVATSAPPAPRPDEVDLPLFESVDEERKYLSDLAEAQYQRQHMYDFNLPANSRGSTVRVRDDVEEDDLNPFGLPGGATGATSSYRMQQTFSSSNMLALPAATATRAGIKSNAPQGLGDDMEDALVHMHENPEEGLVERYDDVALAVRGRDAGDLVEVPRPNLPPSAVVPRGAAIAKPVTATAPPVLLDKKTSAALLDDPNLDPKNREGKVSEALLTWQEAIDAAVDSYERDENEEHASKGGYTSGEESETDEANMQLHEKGQFVPASGGRPIKSTMASYKDKYKRLCAPLMHACNLSAARKNVSKTALDLLFKTMRLCGDFPQSRHTYYSQIKGHIEMVHCLSAELSKKYERNFGILMGMRKRPHQQTGFRASDMVRMAQRLGSSCGAHEAVMQVVHGDSCIKINAELAFRFMVGCWWTFMRPDCSGHASREIIDDGTAVRYKIHSSKRVQHEEVVAETVLECCCKYLPRTKICLCPVHCISDSDWSVMQRALKIQSDARKKKLVEEAAGREPGAEDLYDDDKEMERPSEAKWSVAIYRILEICGIASPRIGADAKKGKPGRHAFGPYSVRIGGCQSARDSNTPEDFIQCIGRWLSARTKDHYKGLAAALPDRLAFVWPIRRSVVFGPETNFNSNYDWLATAREADLSALDADEFS